MSAARPHAPASVGFEHFRCNCCWERFFAPDADPDADVSTFKIHGCNHNVCEKCMDEFHANASSSSTSTSTSSSATSTTSVRDRLELHNSSLSLVPGSSLGSDWAHYCPVCRRHIDPRTDVVEITPQDILGCSKRSLEMLKAIYLNPHSACGDSTRACVRACGRERAELRLGLGPGVLQAISCDPSNRRRIVLAVWNTVVQDALAFTQFQWQALATHEQHAQRAMRAKYHAAQRKLADECDDLRNENKLLAEKSRRVMLQVRVALTLCSASSWSSSSPSSSSSLSFYGRYPGDVSNSFADDVALVAIPTLRF